MYPYRHVQIVLRLYRYTDNSSIKPLIVDRNISEVLIGFDIDCCSVGYDGTTIYAIPRSRRALNTRCM